MRQGDGKHTKPFSCSVEEKKLTVKVFRTENSFSDELINELIKMSILCFFYLYLLIFKSFTVFLIPQ